MANLIQPSYVQGFARYPGESERPNLWHNLQGAWIAALGPTALTLRDASLYRNHGTLTNMPLTAWGVADGGYALSFADRDDDYVNIPYAANLNGLTGITVLARVAKAGNTQIYQAIIGKPFTTSHGSPYFDWLLGWHSDTTQINTRIGGLLFSSDTALNLNQWYTMGFSADGTNWTIYVDGQVDKTQGSAAVPTNTNSQDVRIGANRDDNEEFHGKLAWAMVFAPAITAAQIQAITADPMAMFRLRRRVFKAPAGVPPSVKPHWYYQRNKMRRAC